MLLRRLGPCSALTFVWTDTGKSAVTIQFAENHFAEAYNPTIENTFHKTIKHKGTEYELEIIDTVRRALLHLHLQCCPGFTDAR